MKQLLVIYILILLLVGCSTRPKQELATARQAMAQAYSAGAPEYASTEYLAAKAALRNAEKLVIAGEHQAARELLPYATAQARQATEQAEATRRKLEQQRAKQQTEEEHRLQQQKQKRKTVKPVQKKSPTKPKAVKRLTHYKVTSEESLWDIAVRKEVYADGMLWPLLYKANRDQIKDPRKVFPGQDLTIPRPTSKQELEAARLEAEESGIFPLY